MINTLLWIFGGMSLVGSAITVMLSLQLSKARLTDTDGHRSPHSSMAEAHDAAPEDKRIAHLEKRVRLFTLIVGFDVFVFCCLLVAKFMH